MDKVRSRGVSFWGWVFVASGAFGIAGAFSPQEQIQLYGLGIFIVGLILSVVTLGCGLFIFKLKEGARQLAIFICLCSLILIPVYLRPMANDLKTDAFWQQQKQVVFQKTKPSDRDKVAEALVKLEEAGKSGNLNFILVLFALPFILIELVPIYFFTRKKVREQFN